MKNVSDAKSHDSEKYWATFITNSLFLSAQQDTSIIMLNFSLSLAILI